MTTESKKHVCSKCGGEGEEVHDCPYDCELGDGDEVCNCCDKCTHECARDV